jgi:polar amino acid transport system substrate-binding protein
MPLAWAEDVYLPIVFEDYPPYEYVEDGEVKGINLDIIREAFKRMGISPYFEPRPWKRALFQLKAGEILALSSGFKSEKRMRFAYFPDAPLGMETNMVIVRSDRGIVVDSLDDLRSITIGVVREYLYGEPFDSMKGLRQKKGKSSQQLLSMLLEGRIDAAIGNKAVFRYLAEKQGKLDQIKFIHEVSSEPLYLMFSVKHGSKARNLARDFGAAVNEMIKDGTFAAIEAKY